MTNVFTPTHSLFGSEVELLEEDYGIALVKYGDGYKEFCSFDILKPLYKAKEYGSAKVHLGPITSEAPQVTSSPKAPHGGPSDYYDFDPGFCTANDVMEHLARDRWLGDALHMKDIFKACFRWGKKSGTSKEYDARKIIYSALRLLQQETGQKETREYLQTLLDDRQFGG